ncbi:MAG: POTRA domain-containing protein, partial [Flavobacteriales bacterium]
MLGITSAQSQTIIGNQVDYAAPLNYRIAGITVVGAQYTDVQAIKLFSGLQEGDEIAIPGDAITDAIRKLWKQKLFTDIGIYAAEFRGNDVFLVISLKESARMTKYVINGVKKSEADNLREKLDLRTMTISTDNVKNNAIKSIRDYYIEKGFYSAQVSISERPDPTLQNGVILEFDVRKGNRIKIEQIVVEGAGIAEEKRDFFFIKGKKMRPVMSTSAVKRSMKETKERDWTRIFKASKFLEEKYEEDKQNIIAKYNKKGFR